MNKKVFGCFIIIVVIAITGFISVYVWRVKTNLSKLENEVNQNWVEFFSYSTERLNILEKNLPNDIILNQSILRNQEEREQYKNHCSEEYVHLEYELNKVLIIFFDSLNISVFNNASIKDEFTSSNHKLNELAEKYNQSVFFYNSYIYQFPNVLIAKQNNYKRKKRFTIEFGVENKDPILQKQEMIESMRQGVDDHI